MLIGVVVFFFPGDFSCFMLPGQVHMASESEYTDVTEEAPEPEPVVASPFDSKEVKAPKEKSRSRSRHRRRRHKHRSRDRKTKRSEGRGRSRHRRSDRSKDGHRHRGDSKVPEYRSLHIHPGYPKRKRKKRSNAKVRRDLTRVARVEASQARSLIGYAKSVDKKQLRTMLQWNNTNT